MKLKLYTPESLEAFVLGRIALTIRANGVFSLSAALTDLMQVKTGDRILIGQNPEDAMELFLLHHPDGFLVRKKERKSAGVAFTNKRLRGMILKDCKLQDKPYNFLVAKEPIQIDGVDCYTIITKSAKTNQ